MRHLTNAATIWGTRGTMPPKRPDAYAPGRSRSPMRPAVGASPSPVPPLRVPHAPRPAALRCLSRKGRRYADAYALPRMRRRVQRRGRMPGVSVRHATRRATPRQRSRAAPRRNHVARAHAGATVDRSDHAGESWCEVKKYLYRCPKCKGDRELFEGDQPTNASCPHCGRVGVRLFCSMPLYAPSKTKKG